MALFTELEQIHLKFVWKNERSQIAKAILRKNRAGEITLFDFRLYYKATVNKIVCWIESPEINPHIYRQLICEKDVKNIQWREYSV